MCVGEEAGLVECLCNAKSVDEIKKECPGYTSLKDYFERAYNCPIANFAEGHDHQHYHGIPSSSQVSGTNTTLEKAKENFLRSLVGYSLVSYILQIKDRHNANILLDRDGVSILRGRNYLSDIISLHLCFCRLSCILILVLFSDKLPKWGKFQYLMKEHHLS